MGLMLGEFLDEYTVTVVETFAMPQTATTVSVESVDPAYQTKMMELLARVGHKQTQVVGWYHSHPGFGCWLSFLDVKTQKSFEQLNRRAVALVVDPVQSAGGRVMVDTFRSVDPMTMAFGSEPRISTGNTGLLKRPTLDQRIRGIDKLFYSVNTLCQANDDLEIQMLQNLRKRHWVDLLVDKDQDYGKESNAFEAQLGGLAELTRKFKDDSALAGKLKTESESLCEQAVTPCLSLMLQTVIF